MDRKRIRKTIGYTREHQTADAAAWFALAQSYRAAAQVLHEFQDRIPSDSRPFILNAGLSLELVLKSILAKKALPIPDENHDLGGLCLKAGVRLDRNQHATLEMLTEAIVWLGRYPAPKTAHRWDDYQDRKLERHIVRSAVGNIYSAVANPKTFPSWDNYKRVWDDCVVAFQSVP